MSEEQEFLDALFNRKPEPEPAEVTPEVSGSVAALNARLDRIGEQVAERQAAQAAKPPPEPTAEQLLLARHAEREQVATLRTLGFRGPSLEVSPGFDGGAIQEEPKRPPPELIYLREDQ